MEDNLMLRCLLDSTESTEAALFLSSARKKHPQNSNLEGIHVTPRTFHRHLVCRGESESSSPCPPPSSSLRPGLNPLQASSEKEDVREPEGPSMAFSAEVLAAILLGGFGLHSFELKLCLWMRTSAGDCIGLAGVLV